jgi:L-lactate dehydrogenase complex protein LldE
MMRVGLFITCLVDGVFPDVGDAMVQLLRRLDVDVDVPLQQTCCGQMHINSGYGSLALPLIKNQVRSFDGYDVVVAPSASCVGSVRHQYEQIARERGDERLVDEVLALAKRTYELSEFLVDVLGVTDVGAYFPHRVAYHPTCHSLRALHTADRSVRLLAAVEGIDLVALSLAESCCGFGGTFALKNSDVSGAMLGDKVECVVQSGAGFVTAADSSCLMHIGGGLTRVGASARTIHLAEVLASTR